MKSLKLVISCTALLFAVSLPAAFSSQSPKLDKEILAAVYDSDVPAIADWLASGGDINRTTKNGNTLLILASKIGDKQTVQYLISQQPNVNAQNEAGATALMIAAKYGHVHVVDMLLEEGADPLIRNNHGITAARFALAYNHDKVFYKLQEAEMVSSSSSKFQRRNS